jgi:hypothetical protein
MITEKDVKELLGHLLIQVRGLEIQLEQERAARAALELKFAKRAKRQAAATSEPSS